MSLWVYTHIKLSWCVTNKTFITFGKYHPPIVTWKSNSENNTHIGDLNNQTHARHKMRPCDVIQPKFCVRLMILWCFLLFVISSCLDCYIMVALYIYVDVRMYSTYSYINRYAPQYNISYKPLRGWLLKHI